MKPRFILADRQTVRQIDGLLHLRYKQMMSSCQHLQHHQMRWLEVRRGPLTYDVVRFRGTIGLHLYSERLRYERYWLWRAKCSIMTHSENFIRRRRKGLTTISGGFGPMVRNENEWMCLSIQHLPAGVLFIFRSYLSSFIKSQFPP